MKTISTYIMIDHNLEIAADCISRKDIEAHFALHYPTYYIGRETEGAHMVGDAFIELAFIDDCDASRYVMTMTSYEDMAEFLADAESDCDADVDGGWDLCAEERHDDAVRASKGKVS